MILSSLTEKLTIESIAHDCGFGSKSNFNRTFKKHSHNLTPSEYIKKHNYYFMPINYVVTPRVNPKDLSAPRKYYAIAKSNGEETVRQLATEISKRNGLSTADVFAVLESFIDLVPERLSEGRIVRLGEFGSFSISLSSEGVEKIEDFTAANIKSNSLHFRPGKLVQNVLNTSDYKKVQE